MIDMEAQYYKITSLKEFRDSINDVSRDVYFKYPESLNSLVDSNIIKNYVPNLSGQYFKLDHNEINPNNIENISQFIPWIKLDGLYYTLKEK